MKDIGTRTVAVGDVVVEPLRWVIMGHKDSWWWWSKHCSIW